MDVRFEAKSKVDEFFEVKKEYDYYKELKHAIDNNEIRKVTMTVYQRNKNGPSYMIDPELTVFQSMNNSMMKKCEQKLMNIRNELFGILSSL